MKKQDLVKSIVETLKTRSTVATIDCKNPTRDQLSGLTVDTLEVIKERLESEKLEAQS